MNNKIFIKKTVSILLVLIMAIAILPGMSNKALAADTYTVQGISLPLEKHPSGGKSYGKDQCWAFAAMVYKKVWGQTISSYRGTQDDFLRDVATGKDRAITAANTKLFVEQVPLGSNIRLSDNVNGCDSNGKNRHSQILIQKDENGFAVYESVNAMVRIRHYTWQQYAAKYASYKYFKYIKFPVPEPIPETILLPEETVKEDQLANLDTIAKDIIRGMDFEQWSEWLLTGKVNPDVLYI